MGRNQSAKMSFPYFRDLVFFIDYKVLVSLDMQTESDASVLEFSQSNNRSFAFFGFQVPI